MWPGAGGTYIRFLLRKILAWIGLPYGLRVRILTSIPLFVITYIMSVTFWVLSLGNFAIMAYFVSVPYQVRVSALKRRWPSSAIWCMFHVGVAILYER